MPELPEVETVKNVLKDKLIGKKFSSPFIYYDKLLKTDIDFFKKDIAEKKVIDITRRGKFLIIHLSSEMKMVFHLRMEGKIYVVSKDNYSLSHLSLFIPFSDDDEALAFYDVRKFGVLYYLKEEDDSIFSSLGKEPFEVEGKDIYPFYKKSNKMIKELLLDQSIMSGIGNIYADEILFKSGISPFKKGSSLTLDEIERIVSNSVEILSLAIKNKGSSVRTYRASEEVKGSFQSFLQVYSRENKLCNKCNQFVIKKRKLSGRGTSYCPKCQRSNYTLCITGKIASGKSEVLSFLKKLNFATLSLDDEIKKMYQDEMFLSLLKRRFNNIFVDDSLDKEKIFSLLFEDKAFKRKYLSLLYSELKKRINDFIIFNDGVKKAVEVPLVFDAKMDKMFDFLVGIETSNQKRNLLNRDKSIKKLSFNDLNSYDENRDKLDYIIKNDSSLSQLYEESKKMVSLFDEKYNSHLENT